MSKRITHITAAQPGWWLTHDYVHDKGEWREYEPVAVWVAVEVGDNGEQYVTGLAAPWAGAGCWYDEEWDHDHDIRYDPKRQPNDPDEFLRPVEQEVTGP